VARLAPGLGRASPGYLYWDCRTDDAKLVVEVLRQAAGFGALVANKAEVTGLIGEGTVRGARVRDRLTQETLQIRARMTVNATGAWAGELHAMADPTPPRLRPSKGVHLVFDRERLPVGCVVVVPSAAGDRGFILLIPWGPRVYAGPTDTPYDGPLESPRVDASDIQLILGSIERAFPVGLVPDDVLASWAGIRPLLDSGPGSTRDLSRRHVIVTKPEGLITITGGKLTTFRSMAEEATDLVSRTLGRGARCRTAGIPLGLTRSFPEATADAEASTSGLGLPPGTGTRLVERYGDDWTRAVDMIRDDPELGHPEADGLPVLGVELALARSRELALDEDDVLVRRTRLSLMGTARPADQQLRSSGR
jgi:glycerol-3-phosphate dehydrogenase